MSDEITYDEFDKRTDRLIALLNAASYLDEGLPGPVVVAKGLPRKVPHPLAVYVYREQINAPDYWMGVQGSDFVGQWNVASIVRAAGDPEQIEAYVSYLCTNVMRVIIAHRADTGYWYAATPGASVATSVRQQETNQTWEIEVIPVRLMWQLAHA